jgi:hypothetical protein
MEKMTQNELGRRSFFTRASKYLFGMGIFGVASIFGLKREGDLSVAKMKKNGLGLSEAQASGQCGVGLGCGGGGGQCGMGMGCSGGGGGGQCGIGMGCGGGGGQCGMGLGCSGS